MSLPLNLHPAGRLHLNLHHNSQGYFIQQLQWSITNFIWKPVITSYAVCLAYNYCLAFFFFFLFATFFFTFSNSMLFDRRMQDNQLSGTLDVLQGLPLGDLYIHILFTDSQHIRIYKTVHFQLFDQLLIDLIKT